MPPFTIFMCRIHGVIDHPIPSNPPRCTRFDCHSVPKEVKVIRLEEHEKEMQRLRSELMSANREDS